MTERIEGWRPRAPIPHLSRRMPTAVARHRRHSDVLGRLAARCRYPSWKHKPTFALTFDMGDYVIIINATRPFSISVRSFDQKMAYRHSGRPGGLSNTLSRSHG